MRVNFGVNDPSLRKAFMVFNELLDQLRKQIGRLHPGAATLDQPFFHCWFLSVPQILVLLDGIQGTEMFKEALWKTRHIVTGSCDFYFDNAHMRKLEASTSNKPPVNPL